MLCQCARQVPRLRPVRLYPATASSASASLAGWNADGGRRCGFPKRSAATVVRAEGQVASPGPRELGVVRSILFCPGSNEKVVRKAATLAADAIVIDLEDAVSVAGKEEAREQVVRLLNELEFGHRVVAVRVNSIGTHWHMDDVALLREAAPPSLRAVVLPKAEKVEDVMSIKAEFAHLPVELWAMIETPLGVVNVESICATGAPTVLIMGTNDLSKELNVDLTAERAELMYSLQKCIVAARAHKLRIFDGVFPSVRDVDGLRAQAEQGKLLGFDGKSLIHPSSIAATNEVWTPSADQVAQSRAIIAAWRDAEANGLGVTVVDGKLVEELHVQRAQQVLAMAEAAQIADPHDHHREETTQRTYTAHARRSPLHDPCDWMYCCGQRSLGLPFLFPPGRAKQRECGCEYVTLAHAQGIPAKQPHLPSASTLWAAEDRIATEPTAFTGCQQLLACPRQRLEHKRPPMMRCVYVA